jgi:prepilin-type N-terminal cleavage/methylation domain-containing protein
MTSIHGNPLSTRPADARPADARLGRGLRGRWRAAGMTLVEMLVAISVLAVMILAVSSILVQTQRFISAAQENRRSHAMAFTIARIIRRDLRRVSKDGFLYISGDNKLIFSTAGPVAGISESTRGDGSIVCYGQQSTSSGTKYLWRPEYICNCTTGTASPDISGERINVNFSILRQCAASSGDANSPFTLQTLANQVASTTPGNMQLPPATASDLKNLWQVLVTDVDSVQIFWTDGTKNTSTGNVKWQNTSLLCTHKNQTDWTPQNITGWPKAVRITFAIKDPSMPKELRGTGRYEVICIIGA